jgi:hypothetical protein
MSGHVSMRYCSAPARLQYSVGLSNGGPSMSDGLDLVSTGVRQGLQFCMLARWSRFDAYCSWDRKRPFGVWCMDMPRKCCRGLRSDMENSDLSLVMRWFKSDVELAVSMMSSTYNRRYAVEEPCRSIKREVSDLEPRNPRVARKSVKRKNHVRGACFRP